MNVSVQHLCMTRITSPVPRAHVYSSKIRERVQALGMLPAEGLRSCVTLSELLNLSISQFPLF